MAQNRYIGLDGTIYQEAPGGGYIIVQQGQGGPVTVGTPDPGRATQRAIQEANLARMAREAAGAPLQMERDRLQLERDRLALEKDRRTAVATPTGKPLRQGDGDKLGGNVDTYAALKGALGNFNDQFAGNAFTNGIENAAQRRFGTGTPGQADWWSNFYATDNIIRNSLYGASLTAGEKQAYDATTIAPSMKPDQIRTNLARRAEVVRAAISRKVSRFKAGGFNPAEIDASLGEYAGDFAPNFKPSRPAETSDKTTQFYASPTDPGSDGGGDMSIARGAGRVEADPVLKGVNGRVNAMLKAGEPDSKITDYLREVGAKASPASVAAALKFRRDNPSYKGNYSVNLENRIVPQSIARQAFQAVGSGPVGAFTTGAADAMTAGRLDNIAGWTGGNSAQVQAAKELLAKANPISSLAGSVTGGALAMGGLELGLAGSGLQAATGIAGTLARSPLAADVAYGAAMGSDAPDSPVLGTLMGGAAGGLGGALGQRMAGAIGGVRNEAAQALRRRGVPLTLGQAVSQSGRVGAAVKGIEDRLSGIPVIGSFVDARRREGMEGFNRAAFDEAVAPINGPATTAIGEVGVEAAQDAVGDAYDTALGGVNVRADMPFVQDMVAAARAGRQLPDPMGGRADYTLRTRVGNSFSPTREMSGRNFQQSVRGLRRDASSVRSEPYGADFGDVTRSAEDALTGMLNRQAPGVVPQVQRANEAYRLTEVLRDAVNRARSGTRAGDPGLFAPSQLSDAAAGNARRFGNSQGTTRQPFLDLTRDGQRVLPNSVPDSGTAGRLALTGVLAGGGAGAGYLGDDAQTGAAVGAALAALQTQAAQRALVASVLNRPQRAVDLSEFLVRNRLGAAVGAPLALQAVPTR